MFRNRDDDIRAWFLANNGHDPLNLMVIEGRLEDEENTDQIRVPPYGSHPLFDREVWDDSACAEYATQEVQEEEDWIDENEWLHAEPEWATRAPSGTGVIIVDDSDLSIETEPAHRLRQDR